MASLEHTSSPSPKSSTVPSSHSPQSNSPRFSVFHRHFHSKSTSDSTSADIQPGISAVSSPTRAEAIRDAKRFLLSTIRDDWSFPPTQSARTAEHELREPLYYRYREEGLSDLDADSDDPSGDATLSTASSSDPYRFENPDAITVSVQDKRRKRRKLVQDEMQWNVGLRIWSQQRDAWTGAVRKQPRPSDTSNWGSRPLSNAYADIGDWKQLDSTEMSADWAPSPHSPLHDVNPPLSPSSASFDPLTSADESSVLLPVYAPLIPPSNPVRASIKPSMYAAIYSKVVVQGLTPTVPIPLPQMVAAMVQGWRAEGNWPPKGGTPSTSIINEGPISRRHSHSHMLRFRKAHDAVNGHEKGRVRRHVGGAMRKALGLTREGDDWDQPEGLGIEFEDGHKDEDVQMEADEKSGNISESFRVD
jgi:hypothetical protein